MTVTAKKKKKKVAGRHQGMTYCTKLCFRVRGKGDVVGMRVTKEGFMESMGLVSSLEGL